jgi:lipid-A-disaccharide synthase
MLVLLPTQKLDAMKAWDGLPGLLANLPGVGSLFAVAINWLILRRRQRFAWPNIWAGEEIVPEWVGKINPGEVAQQAIFWLDHPESLQSIRQRLHRFRGEPGASEELAKIVREILRF